MAVSLEEILEFAPEAKIRGSGYVHMNCPFHTDNHASLLVYADGWYHCRAGCESGRIEWLYDKLQGLEVMPGSLRKVTGRPPHIPTNPNELEELVQTAHTRLLPATSLYRLYPEARQIDNMIEPCMLGWHQGWLVIPIRDDERRIKGAVLRSGPQAQTETGIRFAQPIGQYAQLYQPIPGSLEYVRYLLDNATKSVCERNTPVICFGIVDAITLQSLGFPTVTTTGGARSFQPNWLDAFRFRFKIVPDKGEDNQAYRLSRGLSWRGQVVRVDFPEGSKDSNDLLVSGQEELLRKAILNG